MMRFDIPKDIQLYILDKSFRGYIATDSDNIRKGYIFIAKRGMRYDGHTFISDALQKGASLIIAEYVPFQLKKYLYQKIFLVQNVNDFCAWLKKKVFREYSRIFHIIGITGTNGKSTVSFLIRHVLAKSGIKCGIIGTIFYGTGRAMRRSRLTTPEFDEIFRIFAEFKRRDVKDIVMEVSSHSLKQGRVAGLAFDSAVFTNLTPEHLDYHGDMRSYLEAKLMLLRQVKTGGNVIFNKDDMYFKDLKKRIKNIGNVRSISFGIEARADVMAVPMNMEISGTGVSICSDGKTLDLESSLIGKFNIYNIMAAYSVCRQLRIKKNAFASAVRSFSGVPGRMENVIKGRPFNIFVDYAHTPDALKVVLETLKILTKGRLLVVFGCGGDRDRQKRPLMGEIAERYADIVFITSDNPRGESPKKIINEIISGMRGENFIVEKDRKSAIKKAVALLKPFDTLLVAGKGHEEYQLIKGKKVGFKDQDIIRECFRR